jgi:hypothetical protein
MSRALPCAGEHSQRYLRTSHQADVSLPIFVGAMAGMR